MIESDYEDSFYYQQNVQQSFNIKDHQELNDINKKKDESIYSDASELRQSNIYSLNIPREIQSLNYSTKNFNSNLIGFKTSIEASSRFVEANNDINQSFGASACIRKKGETIISNQTNGDELGQQNLENNNTNAIGANEKQEPRKLMLAINLLVNVKGFYRKVTQNSRILEKLSREQHNQIGDITSYYIKDQYNKKKLDIKKIYGIYQQVYEQIDGLIQHIPLCAPYSRFKQIWDLIQALLEMIVTFLFSLYIFFQLNVEVYSNLFLICFSFFLWDVLVNFNTGILQEGTVIYNRKLIAINYIKGNFFFDVIGLLPFMNYFWVGGVAYSNNSIDSVLMSTLISMKWFSLGANLSKLSFFLSYQKGMKNSLDLIKLIFIMLCVCHIFSLVWHGVAIYETNYLKREDSWLHAYGLIDLDVWSRYLYSFYYLTVTMTTTGYGDICPKNQIEVIFAIGIIFTTAIFWAFFLNKIGQIIDNMEEKEKQYKENMLIIHRLMREEDVGKELRVKISNYLKYIYKESNEVQKSKEREIIERLSKQLRDDLILDMNGKYIKNIPLLDKLQQKNKLAQVMEECLFSPGEYIFKQDQVDDSSVYYIVKGSVSIIFESDFSKKGQSIVIQVLGKQQYFGEIGFLFETKRAYSAKANNFCRLYKLQRELFEQIIKESEYDSEILQMIKESIQMKDNYKFQNIRCYSCNQGNHLSLNCPKTHLTISKQIHINRHNYSKPHLERNQFARCKKKVNSLNLVILAHNAVFQINDNPECFEFLDNIEEGLNLSDHELSDIYISEQEYQSDYENQNILSNNNQYNIQNTMIKHHDEQIIDSSQMEYSTLSKSRSLVKKSTATSVPLLPCRQSQDQNGMTFQNQQEIIDEVQKEEESLSSQSISSSDPSSSDQTSQHTEQTITNKESQSSKQGGQKYNHDPHVNYVARKQQSAQTLVRADSKKLSYNVTQDHSSLFNQNLKGNSSLLPVTTVFPPSDTNGLLQDPLTNIKKNQSEVQNNQLKENDLHSIGGTHVGSLTSITSRTRIPSRLACIPEKDSKRSPTMNSYIDTNFIHNNDPIRSLTKISTHSANKEKPLPNQATHSQSLQQQNNVADKKLVLLGQRNEGNQGRMNRLRERRSLNRDGLLANQLQQQLQELLLTYQDKSASKKNKTDIQKQKQRARINLTNEKLQNQLKNFQNSKSNFTTHSALKNLDKITKSEVNNPLPQNAVNVEEQILSALKVELENQQEIIENEDEIRDKTNYLNLIEFDRAYIFKYYYKNDNYYLVVQRYQDYWNKINQTNDKKMKLRKKKLKKRFKSKANIK